MWKSWLWFASSAVLVAMAASVSTSGLAGDNKLSDEYARMAETLKVSVTDLAGVANDREFVEWRQSFSDEQFEEALIQLVEVKKILDEMDETSAVSNRAEGIHFQPTDAQISFFHIVNYAKNNACRVANAHPATALRTIISTGLLPKNALSSLGMTPDDLLAVLADARQVNIDFLKKLDLHHICNMMIETVGDSNIDLEGSCASGNVGNMDRIKHVVDVVHAHLPSKASWYKTKVSNGYVDPVADEWFVVSDGDSCIVMIDGSDLPAIVPSTHRIEPEWASNLRFVQAPITWDGAHVGEGHEGFVEAWNEIAKDLQSKIVSVCGLPKRVTYAGHSRGGAIAQIAAVADYHRIKTTTGLLLGAMMKWEVASVTWGNPRSLSTNTANQFDQKFQQDRVMNRLDPVPGLVPAYFQNSHYQFVPSGFRHMGSVHCLNCQNSAPDDTSIEDRDIANSPDITQAAAHSSELYWQKLMQPNSVSCP